MQKNSGMLKIFASLSRILGEEYVLTLVEEVHLPIRMIYRLAESRVPHV